MTIQITERELAALTSDMDGMHRDLMPAMTAAMAGLADHVRGATESAAALAGRRASRRSFLSGGLAAAGMIAGGVVLSACGDTFAPASAAASPTPTPGDAELAVLAAGIELLAVNTYTTALKAASQGVFGKVPDAVSRFAETAKSQHNDHLAAWNGVLIAAGRGAATAPDAKLAASIQGEVAALKTIADVAKLALQLETIAMETYVASAALLAAEPYRSLALTVAPVEAQHVAILNFVIGVYPVPDDQIKTDQARSVSDLS